MRAPRRATSTAAAVLLVTLPATAAPSVGQGAARVARPAVPGVASAGPLAGAVPDPVAHPVHTTPAPAPAPDGSVAGYGTVALGSPASSAFSGEVVDGIPVPALRAYQAAAATVTRENPGCGLDWALLAGIGRVESDHGRYGGSILDAAGVAQPAILGPVLSGAPGMARISDTDAGRLDGDPTWDRAVGPMQFIPSTWAISGADGDGDGVANPQDLNDAALAAARYLCAGGARVSTLPGAQAALLRYNHSTEYGMRVLWLASAYRTGSSIVALPTPRSTGTPQPVGGTGTVRAAGDDGTVRAAAPQTPVHRPRTAAATPDEPASETVLPTATPTWTPRTTSTPSPTSSSPTSSPTTTPTTSPTTTPTTSPTTSPTTTPTTSPTTSSTTSPSSSPTSPSSSPTTSPSSSPTSTTSAPTSATSTDDPTACPSATPEATSKTASKLTPSETSAAARSARSRSAAAAATTGETPADEVTCTDEPTDTP